MLSQKDIQAAQQQYGAVVPSGTQSSSTVTGSPSGHASMMDRLSKIRAETTATADAKTKQERGFLGDVGAAITKTGQGLKESFDMAPAPDLSWNTVKKTADAGLHAAGAVGHGLGEVAGAAFNRSGASDLIGAVAKASPVGVVATNAPDSWKQAASDLVQKGGAEWQKFEQEHPDAARRLKDVGGIAEGAATLEGISSLPSLAKGTGQVLKEGAENIGQFGRQAAENIATKAKGAVDNIGGTALKEQVSGVDQQALNVLDPNRKVPKLATRTITELDDAGNAVQKQVSYEPPSTITPEEQAQKSTNLNRYIRKAERAAADPSQETPLEIAGRRGEDALSAYNQKLTKWGQVKEAEMAKVGHKPMDINPTKEKIFSLAEDRLGVHIVPEVDRLGTVTGYKTVNAPGRVSKIALDPADQKLLTDVFGFVRKMPENSTIREVDGAVDAIQDLLYKRKQNVAIPVNEDVEGLLKEATGTLNSELKKKAGTTFTKANNKYSFFIDKRNSLNSLLGREGSKGGSLMKRVFSPTDSGTKKLFAQIKRDTGIDLVEDATMAKVAMELAGDVRQRSLLEGLQLLEPGSGSVQNRLLNFAINKAKKSYANPLEVVRNAAKGTGKAMRK